MEAYRQEVRPGVVSAPMVLPEEEPLVRAVAGGATTKLPSAYAVIRGARGAAGNVPTGAGTDQAKPAGRPAHIAREVSVVRGWLGELSYSPKRFTLLTWNLVRILLLIVIFSAISDFFMIVGSLVVGNLFR